MPESWETKLNEFYKLLEGEEQSLKQGSSSQEKPAEAAAPSIKQPAAQTSAKIAPRPVQPEHVQPTTTKSAPVANSGTGQKSSLTSVQTIQSEPVATPEKAPAVNPWPTPIPGLRKPEPESQLQKPELKTEPISAIASARAEEVSEQLGLEIPKLEDYLTFLKDPSDESASNAPVAAPSRPSVVAEPAKRVEMPQESPVDKVKADVSKTETKPRLRTPQPASSADIQQAWDRLPKHIQMLVGSLPAETAQRYYTKKFKETRDELVQRLLDPSLSLEDTARILNVCPMTVRRYTNRGALPHFRTVGNQRRFRLSDVLSFLESRMGVSDIASAQGTAPSA
jgi:excisionase family DNA binding protein